jgi:hypothetical protein
MGKREKTYAHELLHLALLEALLQLAGFGLGESGLRSVNLLSFVSGGSLMARLTRPL